MDNKNMYENILTNPLGTNSSLRVQPGSQPPIYQTDTMPKMTGNMAYQVVYPEIFYKLQPYIIMVCDQMDTYGPMMPTQDMVEQLTDSIYDDVCRMYPDMAEYARDYETKAKDDPPEGRDRGMSDRDRGMFDRGMFGRRFRRRGAFRDLIDILLLSEFFRRRRRMY